MSETDDERAAIRLRRAIPPGAGEGWWAARDGWRIRRIDWALPAGQAPRGAILYLPGRGDTYEKYLETLDRWARAGWRVTAADWRGQAGSGRLGSDGQTGHIADFAIWVDDLAALWADWQRETPGPHVLAAHSMGGHLALRALAQRCIAPDAAVLVAPMLGFRPALAPLAAMHALARLMCAIGDPRRPAWKWEEKPGVPPAGRRALLTHDASRYADEAWWRAARPELAMGAPSWGWMERALASVRGLARPGVLEGVSVPLLILATSADRLVDFGAIARAARRLPRAELLAFGEEAAHEILREEDGVRDRALAAIDEFLDRAAPLPERGARE